MTTPIIVDLACWERGCACYNPRVDTDGIPLYHPNYPPKGYALVSEEWLRSLPQWPDIEKQLR